jgi:hypothetical protein
MSRGVVSCCFSVKPKHNDSFTLFTRAEAKRNDRGKSARAVRLGKALALQLLFFFFSGLACQSNVTTALDLTRCPCLRVMKQ